MATSSLGAVPVPHNEHENGWPSVTTVLGCRRKRFLETWRGKLGNAECDRIQKESTDIGKAFHDEVERYLRTGAPPESRMGQKWLEWAKGAGFKSTDIELHVQSSNYQYHGTFDAVGHLDGIDELLVFDWKTSSKIDLDEYPMQLAAYAEAYREQTGIEINSGYVVRVDKPTKVKNIKVEAKRFDGLKGHFVDFLHCLAIYNRMKKYETRWGR